MVSAFDPDELAQSAFIPVTRIRAIAQGERPTDLEIARLGRILPVDASELLIMRKAEFPNVCNGGTKDGV